MTSVDSFLNSISRQEKERLAQYLLELEQNRDVSKLRNFQPNKGFQENFIKSTKKIRLIFVGNQEGKTTAGAYEHACYALGCHPHKKIRIPNIGWIVTAKPLREGVEKDILPKILELVGSEDIRAIKNNSQGVPYKIIWRTGSVTFILSSEQDDTVFEGTTIDHAWFDEPFRRQIYVAVRRGMMKAGGHLWWSMTPLDEPWIYDELYERYRDGDEEIEVFEGQPGENVHVSKEERLSFQRTLDPDEIESRIYGKPQHLSGRVFKAYKPEIHRVPSIDIPAHWPVYISIDPHKRKPHAVLFLACAPTNAFYVCNEIYVRCEMEELRDLIIDLASQYRVVDILGDSSLKEDDWRHMNGVELLKPLQVRIAQKHNKKTAGILYINQLFSKNQLFVMEHCKRTHRELLLQVYKRIRMKDGSISEEPEKKFDDMTDDLRYIFAERPDFAGPAKIKTRPVPYRAEIR